MVVSITNIHLRTITPIKQEYPVYNHSLLVISINHANLGQLHPNPK